MHVHHFTTSCERRPKQLTYGREDEFNLKNVCGSSPAATVIDATRFFCDPPHHSRTWMRRSCSFATRLSIPGSGKDLRRSSLRSVKGRLPRSAKESLLQSLHLLLYRPSTALEVHANVEPMSTNGTDQLHVLKHKCRFYFFW